MATSTAQTIPLVELYDYFLAPGDPSSATTSKGKSGRTVKVTLEYDKALTIAPDAVVWAAQEPVVSALTDANGFWHVFLVPNNKISPANTYYTVSIDGGPSYQVQLTDVGVPAAGWQSSAPGILLNIPSALAPTTSTVGAITATGLITAQAGINVTAGGISITAGGATVVGGLTVDTITYSQAVSRLIPGGTSFSVRDTGNANDNLLVTNAGNVTVRGSLTVTAGPLTVSALGAAITGNSTITGTLTVTSTSTFQNTLTVSTGGVTITAGGLTVSAGGATIAGNSTVTGTLVVSSNLQAANLILSTAASLIVPGATSLAFTNHAQSANNLTITDAGLATLRNALSIPPSAGGTVATTSYGTVPVKIEEQTLSGAAATIRIPASGTLPTGFRAIRVRLYARGDTNATLANLSLQFNGDTGAHYSYQSLTAIGTVAAATDSGASLGTSGVIGDIPALTAVANSWSNLEITIDNYNAANRVQARGYSVIHHTDGTPGGVLRMASVQTSQAAALTFLTLLLSGGNFITGTVAVTEGLP